MIWRHCPNRGGGVEVKPEFYNEMKFGQRKNKQMIWRYCPNRGGGVEVKPEFYSEMKFWHIKTHLVNF